ncbi:MAG TPA: hypothetical protein VFU49_23325 [Ktedonobacteraceae bacterium]|nr:hypothetical protein [Ktedonobacteraceae bacterium]
MRGPCACPDGDWGIVPPQSRIPHQKNLNGNRDGGRMLVGARGGDWVDVGALRLPWWGLGRLPCSESARFQVATGQ